MLIKIKKTKKKDNDNDKTNKNKEKDNHSSNNVKKPILPKKHFSQKFPTTFINQRGSIFYDNLSKEIEKLKKRNTSNETTNNMIKKKKNQLIVKKI